MPVTANEACENEREETRGVDSQGGVNASPPEIHLQIGGVNLRPPWAEDRVLENTASKVTRFDCNTGDGDDSSNSDPAANLDRSTEAQRTDPEVDPAQKSSGTDATTSSGFSTSS